MLVKKVLYLRSKITKEYTKVMEDLVLSIPAQDAAFIETLAQRMGWTLTGFDCGDKERSTHLL